MRHPDVPTSFQLMGHPWTVVHHDGHFRAPDGDEVRGLCDFDSLTITVDVSQPVSMVRHTFMHELMHAVLWTLGKDQVDDEQYVDSLGGALAQVFGSAS